MGARSWGLGNATTALVHQQSYFSNPAGLGFAQNSYINSSFESRFDISGLSTMSLSALSKSKYFNAGFGIERFGDNVYNETKAGIALAKNTGRVSLGIKAGYLSVSVLESGSRNSLITEFGVLAKLSSKFQLGFHANNLTGAHISSTATLPTILHLGLAFMPTGKINFLADAEMIPGEKPFIKSGLEYNIHSKIRLRTGINTGIRTNHFGLGFWDKKWQFDYAVNTHPALGLSHHFSININIGKVN